MDKKVKKFSLDLLREYLKKAFITKILGSAIGGVKLFVIKYVFDLIWKKALGPLIRIIWRKAAMSIHKQVNKKKVQDLKEATSEQDIIDSVDKLP